MPRAKKPPEKKKRYEEVWYEVAGHRYVARAKTKAEAYEKMYKRKAKLEQEAQEETRQRSGEITVAEWIDIAFDAYKKNIAKETRDNSRYRLKKQLLPTIGHMRLVDVKNTDLQTLVMNQQEGKSYSHVKSLRQEIQWLFEKAVRDGRIKKSPAIGLEQPKYVKGERRAITQEEREHLLKVCENNKKYTVFLLMLYCGCRSGEARECERSDIEEVDGVPILHIRGTKTKNADRYVPVPDKLWQQFKDLPPTAPLASHSRGGKLSKSTYNRLIASLRKDMNISMGVKTYGDKLVPPLKLADDFVPYCLRHTYCTDLAHARVDLRIAKDLMGHANIMITADIYTHAIDDDISEVVDSAGLLAAYYEKIGEK